MAESKGVPVFLKDYGGAMHWNIMQHDRIPGFAIRPDDVWLCSFPRPDTTVTQQIVYLVMTLDFEAARTVPLDDRFPFADLFWPDYSFMGLDYLEQLPPDKPRMIKSHLHHFLLPDQLKAGKGKIIYAVRNPKSCLLSQYKQSKYFYKYPDTQDSFDDFIDDALRSKTYATPWGLHVKQYWEKSKECDSVHIVQFNDIVNDRKTVIRNIAKFLNKDLTEDDVDAIFEETSIETMINNPAVNLDHVKNKVNAEIDFINKGLTDGWKDELSPESVRKLDEMIEETVGNTDLKFD